MKWVAGFETAMIHWNGRCMADYTGHNPENRMAQNYERIRQLGFAGAREGLAWHRPLYPRLRIAPEDFPVFWSLHHFGTPAPDPRLHAEHVIAGFDLLRPGEQPIILPVVEPSVGYDVSGIHPQQALKLALAYMDALGGRATLMTGDPIHRLDESEWAITDELVRAGAEIVGVHCYGHHLCVPLREVIGAAKARYGLPVVLGETGFHDGHPGNEGRIHGCTNRLEWKAYVEQEAQDALWACWMPVLGVNWDGGEPWPSDWPGETHAQQLE